MREQSVSHPIESRSLIAAWVLMATLALAMSNSGIAADETEASEAANSANADDELVQSDLPNVVKAERKLMDQPSDRKSRLEAARAYLALGADQQGNVDAARTHILAVLAENPNDVESLLLAGQTSLLKNDAQAAARYYRTATLTAPDNASAFIGLGDALTRLQDEEGANAAFEKYRALKGMSSLSRAKDTK